MACIDAELPVRVGKFETVDGVLGWCVCGEGGEYGVDSGN